MLFCANKYSQPIKKLKACNTNIQTIWNPKFVIPIHYDQDVHNKVPFFLNSFEPWEEPHIWSSHVYVQMQLNIMDK
jgi:hypothetical protein